MSILSKLSNLRSASDVVAQVPMTDTEVAQCKAALKRDARGPSVMVNKWDRNVPYRVSTILDDNFTNHGSFKSADVAAAVGTIASMSVFGEKAIRGLFDESLVENDESFQAWLLDPRNAAVLARVNAGTCLIETAPSVEAPADDGPVF